MLFFKAYIPEKGSENVEKILSMLGDEIIGLTSRWTILEIIRGIIKRRNLGELAREDAEDIIKFFLYDLKKMEMERKLILVDVSKKIIEGSIEYIIKHNLYAADALHLKTAEIHSADAMLVDDYHFKRIQSFLKVIKIF